MLNFNETSDRKWLISFISKTFEFFIFWYVFNETLLKYRYLIVFISNQTNFRDRIYHIKIGYLATYIRHFYQTIFFKTIIITIYSNLKVLNTTILPLRNTKSHFRIFLLIYSSCALLHFNRHKGRYFCVVWIDNIKSFGVDFYSVVFWKGSRYENQIFIKYKHKHFVL